MYCVEPIELKTVDTVFTGLPTFFYEIIYGMLGAMKIVFGIRFTKLVMRKVY